MSLFTDALAGGLASMRGMAADGATYWRGSTSWPILAARGQTTFETLDASGTTLVATAVDFLTEPGAFGEPERGDTIEPAAGGLYEVMLIAGEGCWRYSDPATRTQLRIHTKQIA
jgi:hypothetical protein